MGRSKASSSTSAGGRTPPPGLDDFEVPEAWFTYLAHYKGPFPENWGRFRMFLWKWLTIGHPSKALAANGSDAVTHEPG